MDRLRFEDGAVAVGVVQDSLWIHKSLGSHHLQVQLEVAVPEAPDLGKVLLLEVSLFVHHGDGHRAWMAKASAAVAYPHARMERPTLRFPLTNAQLIAVEQARLGDLHLELEVDATAPQAAGYPGCAPINEHITVPESRWRQQLEGLGRSLAVEMSVPFPAGDEPRQEAVNLLRDAQRRLAGNDIDGAMLQVRRALEWILDNSGWPKTPAKDKTQRSQAERWSAVRAALTDQASGALHNDTITKSFTYSRADAESMIAMAASLLRVVP